MALNGVNSVDTNDQNGRQRQGERGASALEVAIIAGKLPVNATPLQFIAMLAQEAGPYAPTVLGWTPQIRQVADGARIVLELYGWVGGAGVAPSTGFLKSDGTLVATAALATDIKGPTGAQGPAGATSPGILKGTGVPGGGTGSDGNAYIDTAAGLIYVPKAAGIWPAGVDMSPTKLPLSGGTMTGQILGQVGSAIRFTASAALSGYGSYYSQSGVVRFAQGLGIGADPTFFLSRYSAAGAFQNNILVVNSAGDASFVGDVFRTQGLTNANDGYHYFGSGSALLKWNSADSRFKLSHGLDVTGTVTMSDWTATGSDERLKEKIVRLASGLSMEIEPFSFEMNGRHNWGVIAQRLLANPKTKHLVIKNADTGLLSVFYEQIIAVLLADVQAITERIKIIETDQQKKMAEIDAKLKSLSR